MNNVPDMTTDGVEFPASEQQMRDEMVRELIELGAARSPNVVAAFRKIPRHLAVSDEDMVKTYQAEYAASRA